MSPLRQLLPGPLTSKAGPPGKVAFSKCVLLFFVKNKSEFRGLDKFGNCRKFMQEQLEKPPRISIIPHLLHRTMRLRESSRLERAVAIQKDRFEDMQSVDTDQMTRLLGLQIFTKLQAFFFFLNKCMKVFHSSCVQEMWPQYEYCLDLGYIKAQCFARPSGVRYVGMIPIFPRPYRSCSKF